MLKQLKGNELSALREKWWIENDKKCPIIGTEIPLSEATLDHCHKLKSEAADESGKGVCRGVLSRIGNSWEGKITNSYKRLGLNKYIDLIQALRNLANYLENNHSHNEVKYIHPSEAPKKLKIKKSSFNKLIKSMKNDSNNKKALPKYNGNASKAILKLFEKYGIEPEYYENNSN